jgi:O-antigen ligase
MWSVVVLPWVLALLARWFGRFTRPFGIGGRENLWMASVDGFLERPLFGWGWMAAWESLTFFPRELWLWRERTGPWSHSSYYDIALGGGVVAVVLFASFVAASLGGHRRLAAGRRLGSIYAGLAVLVLAASTQESFVIGNHVLLALLVGALTGPWLVDGARQAPPAAAAPAPR